MALKNIFLWVGWLILLCVAFVGGIFYQMRQVSIIGVNKEPSMTIQVSQQERQQLQYAIITISGTVKSVSANSLTLLLKSGQQIIFAIPQNTPILEVDSKNSSDTPINLSELQSQERVSISLQEGVGNSLLVSRVLAVPNTNP